MSEKYSLRLLGGGRLLVYDKSIRLKDYHLTLYFGEKITISDLDEGFLGGLTQLLNATYLAGKKASRADVTVKFQDFLESFKE